MRREGSGSLRPHRGAVQSRWVRCRRQYGPHWLGALRQAIFSGKAYPSGSGRINGWWPRCYARSGATRLRPRQSALSRPSTRSPTDNCVAPSYCVTGCRGISLSADYVAVEAKARDAKRELWKGEFVPPWDWRRGERLSDSGTSVDPAVSAVCCKICRKGKACGNSCNAKWMTAFSLLGDHVMADQVRLNAQKEAAANATTTAKFRSSHNHRCLQQFRLLLPPIRRYARHLA